MRQLLEYSIIFQFNIWWIISFFASDLLGWMDRQWGRGHWHHVQGPWFEDPTWDQHHQVQCHEVFRCARCTNRLDSHSTGFRGFNNQTSLHKAPHSAKYSTYIFLRTWLCNPDYDLTINYAATQLPIGSHDSYVCLFFWHVFLLLVNWFVRPGNLETVLTSVSAWKPPILWCRFPPALVVEVPGMRTAADRVTCGHNTLFIIEIKFILNKISSCFCHINQHVLCS